MNTPIKTNQIFYNKINRDKFYEKYDVFAVNTTEKYFRTGAYIIDAPVLEKNVCAVQFEKGSKFYVMMHKNSNNKRLLHKAVSDVEGAEFITINRADDCELEDRTILQLLLNSLGSVENSEINFNNITGHLYCFHKDWIIHSKKDNAVLQIKSLEIGISPDYRLQFNVRTFTSELLKSKIKFGKKKFKDYPQYVISAHKTLRCRLKTDTGMSFILRQKDGKKSTIQFMNVINFDAFEKSKMGVVSSVILRFNEKFSDITKIDFQDITDYISHDCMKHDKDADKDFIKEKLQSPKFYIVDKINDNDSTEFCTNLKELLFKEYQIQAEIRKRIAKNGMNLCLIHNADYYIGQEDPHKQYSDTIVQHITFEDFEITKTTKHKNGTVTIEMHDDVAQAMHELMIKADLLNNKITLFNWSDMEFNCKISFGIRVEKNNKIHYFFMTVKPDGAFEISKLELTFFEEAEYNECIEIFEDNPEVIKGIIRDEYGNINIIKDTHLVAIPEIFKIRKELENGNTAIRNKEKRNELFPSVIDIKQFNHNNSVYYFAGVLQNNMKYNISTAVNIREIGIYGDSTELFSKLLSLMDISFVSNGKLTVIPFPFKYLREYVKKLGY